MKLQNYQKEQKIMNIEKNIQDLSPKMAYSLPSILPSYLIGGCSYLDSILYIIWIRQRHWVKKIEYRQKNKRRMRMRGRRREA